MEKQSRKPSIEEVEEQERREAVEEFIYIIKHGSPKQQTELKRILRAIDSSNRKAA